MTAPGDQAAQPGAPARRRRALMVVAAVVAALALTATVSYRWGSAGAPQAVPTPTPERTDLKQLTPAEIFAALAPSVVTIEATGAGPAGASGTGVIANADGHILTALHIVSGASDIRVTFADGTPSEGVVIWVDPAIDIAILIPVTLPTVVVPATLGNAGRLSVGDGIVAIGNQLGLTSSATAGVVSGLNRATTGNDGTRLAGLIQFDAAVNPGSSGGPLVNARGETVGIVVALANPTAAGTFIGIGFAVPIGIAVAAGSGDRPPQ